MSSSRKRLTREESHDETRQRLLDAAQKLIARKGLWATSVEKIAEAAGYTRGAFYSNFNSKDDLFIELLRCDYARAHAGLGVLRNDSLSLDDIKKRARELYGQIHGDNESFLTWTEARMLAARDVKFRAKLNALLAEKRAEVAVFIEYFYRRVGVPAPVSPAALAIGFMSLFEGMKLSLLSSPTEVASETAESVLAVFIDSIMRIT